MTATSLIYSVHAGQGANIQYCWHVHGMPWAICESKALQALLTASNTYRDLIFGTSHNAAGTHIGRDTAQCPIFVGLERPGKVSWELKETSSELVGGGWQVTILDKPYAQTWINFGSDDGTRYGLPGIHHVSLPLADSTALFAELILDCLIGDTTINVNPIGGGSEWETAIEKDSGVNGYRLAWIGGECMILNNDVPVGPGPTVQIISRGVFRSREQNHIVDPEGASPILYDMPPSVVGQMCTLWACHLSDDGTSMASTPVPMETGRISPDIKTSDGKTTIGINSILDNLDETIKIEPIASNHLVGYSFYRDIGGTDWEQLRKEAFQMPHLLMYEFDDEPAGDVPYYVQKCIWLCEQESALFKLTWQEVKDALIEELRKCSSSDATINHSQVSGDGTADNDYVSLKYSYKYVDGYLCQYETADGAPITKGDRMTIMTGPLAWLFNLGAIWIGKSNYEGYSDVKEELLYCPAPGMFYAARQVGLTNGIYVEEDDDLPPAKYMSGPWMVCGTPTALGDCATFPEKLQDMIYHWGTYGNSRQKYISKYYYEWQWDYVGDSLDEWMIFADTDYGHSPRWGGDDAQLESLFQCEADRFYVKKDSPYLDDDKDLVFGSPTDFKRQGDGTWAPRYATGTIDVWTESTGSQHFTLDPTLAAVDGYPTPFRYGAGLYYIEPFEKDYWESKSDSGSEETTDIDPWRVQVGTPLASDTLSDIFRAILADSGASISLLPALQMSNICGFTTVGDLVSHIDWTDFDTKMQAVASALHLTYRLEFGAEINVKKEFFNCLLLHGVAPTWEWAEDASGNQQWFMRFRYLGPANLTDAYFSNRTITESKMQRGKGVVENHSHNIIANQITCDMNFQQDKYRLPLKVNYRSSFVQSGDEIGKIKIESKLCHINVTSSEDEEVVSLKNHFRSLLRFFAQPNWSNKCVGLHNNLFRIGLGREALVTDRSAHDPIDHSLGLTDQPVFIVKMDHDLDGNGLCNITYRFANQTTYGWAPSALVTSSVKVTAGGRYYINCTTTAHQFSSSTERKDLMWFDCYSWSTLDGYDAKDCSCTSYPVIATIVGDNTGAQLGGSAELVVLSVNSSTNVIQLEDVSAAQTHYNAWDTADDHIIHFDTWDNCQPCQQKFIFLCDDTNYLGASDDPAFRWI